MAAQNYKLIVFASSLVYKDVVGSLPPGWEAKEISDLPTLLEATNGSAERSVLLLEESVSGRELFLEAAHRLPSIPRLAMVPQIDSKTVDDVVGGGLALRLLEVGSKPEIVREALLLAKQWLAATDRKKGLSSDEQDKFRNQLLMTAAHDFRSPLSIIAGYSQMLLETETEISDRGRGLIERTEKTCERLLYMAENLLDVTLLEEGQLRLEPAPILIHEMVEEVVDNMLSYAKEKDITLTAELTESDVPFNLDKMRVGQVLQNILVNAVKYTPPGGTVRVSGNSDKDVATIQITDNGPGIPDDQKEKVFEKFARLGSSGQRGSGLGLAIARTVVERHGGKIWVENAPGGGSVFVFTLASQPIQR